MPILQCSFYPYKCFPLNQSQVLIASVTGGDGTVLNVYATPGYNSCKLVPVYKLVLIPGNGITIGAATANIQYQTKKHKCRCECANYMFTQGTVPGQFVSQFSLCKKPKKCCPIFLTVTYTTLVV